MDRSAFIGFLAVAAASPAIAAAQVSDPAEHRLIGRVIAFRPYHLQLDRGPSEIILHPGTVIRPRGMTPQNGMWVRVIGHRTADGLFSADEIRLLPPPPRPL